MLHAMYPKSNTSLFWNICLSKRILKVIFQHENENGFPNWKSLVFLCVTHPRDESEIGTSCNVEQNIRLWYMYTKACWLCLLYSCKYYTQVFSGSDTTRYQCIDIVTCTCRINWAWLYTSLYGIHGSHIFEPEFFHRQTNIWFFKL